MAIKRLTITQYDGTELIVTPNLGDTLNFETTLKKNPRWGSLQENVLRLTPFRAWSAAKRTGVLDQTWEEFSDGPRAALDVSPTADADNTDDDDSLAVDGVGLDTQTAQPSIY